MKTRLRRLFWFILRYFEAGDEAFTYKPLNRKILIVVGVLFFSLGIGVVIASVHQGSFAYALPIVVFLTAGLVCTVVGFLGSDRAIAKIWGNR